MKAKAPSLSFLLLTIIASHTCVTSFAADDFAWRDTNTYRSPNFEATFPYDLAGGLELQEFVRTYRHPAPIPTNIFELYQRGLRTCPSGGQPALSFLGNQYIWGKSPQDPRAIDLMYHAAGSTNRETSYNAIYFGLSTVRPMTEPILRTLVDISIKSQDPNTLSRVAWGGATHKDRLLFYLQPYLASKDPAIREHAQTLDQIFSGKLKAFAWAAEVARKQAEAKYSNRLEEFRTALEKGDSAKRHETLELIQRDAIASIMDESFIPAFAAAAADPDYKIRDSIATITGSRWIWNASDQAPEAIELMMRLSRDDNRNVRYNANYYGLSVIRHRTDAEVERMIEMAMRDGMDNPDFLHRITWGLERDRNLVLQVLEKWMNAYKSGLIKAAYAYGFHFQMLKKEPEVDPEFLKILDERETPVARLLVFAPKELPRVNSIEEYITLVRQELPAELAPKVPWNNDDGPPFMIAGEGEEAALKNALLNSSRFKVEVIRTLTVENLIDLGKGRRFRDLK